MSIFQQLCSMYYETLHASLRKQIIKCQILVAFQGLGT